MNGSSPIGSFRVVGVYWNWIRRDRTGAMDLPLVASSSKMDEFKPENWTPPKVPGGDPGLSNHELPIG